MLGSDAEASTKVGWIHQLHTHLGQTPTGATVAAWGAVALFFLAAILALSGPIMFWLRRRRRARAAASMTTTRT